MPATVSDTEGKLRVGQVSVPSPLSPCLQYSVLLCFLSSSLIESVPDGAILEPKAEGKNRNTGLVFILFFTDFLH